uniref:Major facilitator superfamily (MFS) profile domain-containing protein n=1 Tax=Ciona savignyi TaxID=51511 RepID=H2Z9B4_CIOSA
LLVVFCATMGSFNVGYALGFSSPATRDFHVYEKELSVTIEESSWFGSMLVLSAIGGSILGGIFTDRFGRKIVILLMLLTYTGGWVAIGVAKSLVPLFIGRFLTGFALGTTLVVVPAYLVEVAPPFIRGGLGSFFSLLLAIGIAVAYAFGFYFRWRGLAHIGTIISSISFLICLWIPESPSWLVKHGKESAARKRLQFLQGGRKSEKEIFNEIENIAQDIRSTQVLEPRFYKPLVVLVFLNAFQHLSGINVIIFYAHSIFRMANFHDESLPSLLVACIQVFALFVPLALMDRLGRRKLAFISGIGVTFCSASIGTCLYVFEMKQASFGANSTGILDGNASTVGQSNLMTAWLSLVSILMFVVFYAMGLGPIPFVVLGELMPLRSRGLGGGIASATNSFTSFLVVKCFHFLVSILNIYGLFWLLAGFGALYVLFCWFSLPETMGRSRDELERLYDRR